MSFFEEEGRVIDMVKFVFIYFAVRPSSVSYIGNRKPSTTGVSLMKIKMSDKNIEIIDFIDFIYQSILKMLLLIILI